MTRITGRWLACLMAVFFFWQATALCSLASELTVTVTADPPTPNPVPVHTEVTVTLTAEAFNLPTPGYGCALYPPTWDYIYWEVLWAEDPEGPWDYPPGDFSVTIEPSPPSENPSVTTLKATFSKPGYYRIANLKAQVNYTDTCTQSWWAEGIADDICITVEEDTALSVSIEFEGVEAGKKQNPGAYVSVNANNDNGSKLTNKIPEKRDFEVSPMPKADPDLKKISLSFKNLNGNETIKLYTETVAKGRAKIKIWDTQDKKNEIKLPAEYKKPADVPKEAYVEGVLEGAVEREISLILEAFDGTTLVDGDIVKITVAPVLQDLKVEAHKDASPDLVDDKQLGWAIVTEAGAPAKESAFTLLQKGLVTNVKGKLRFIQVMRIKNNLAGGWGADLGGGVQRKWDYAVPNEGKWLVDSGKKDLPFYFLNEKHDLVNNIETVSATDDPALPMDVINSVLPAMGNTTTVDVTYEYITHAVIHYNDDSVYSLGKTTWNARYEGEVTQPDANDYKFADGKMNANNGSAAFGAANRDNSNPVALGPTTVNDSAAHWR